MLLAVALPLLALATPALTASIIDLGPACETGLSQHCIYTVGDRYIVGKSKVDVDAPNAVLATKYDRYGGATFLVNDLVNGTASLRCRSSPMIETFIFVFQNAESWLVSRAANTGRANAYFNDGVSRAKLIPAAYMKSTQAGVDIVVEC